VYTGGDCRLIVCACHRTIGACTWGLFLVKRTDSFATAGWHHSASARRLRRRLDHDRAGDRGSRPPARGTANAARMFGTFHGTMPATTPSAPRLASCPSGSALPAWSPRCR
jgi:hypothetical protein